MGAPPSSPLEDDDLLEEILLRLPPQPSSLPLASGVCKRWLDLITDPKFINRFCAHHRKPPLLGVFNRGHGGVAFTPMADSPDRTPPLRFDVRRYAQYEVLGCRHGRVLAVDPWQRKLHVCDPITGKKRRVAVPREFRRSYFAGSILCADRAVGHAHGGCCGSGPFKVALMTVNTQHYRPMARVYSSETGKWGKTISTAGPCELSYGVIPGALVGNALYWVEGCTGRDILVLDLDEQSLALITWPPTTSDFHPGQGWIIQGDDGAVGLAILSYPRFQMWQRSVHSHSVATWVVWKTVELNDILGLPQVVRTTTTILGYCEDTDAIFISVHGYVYMVQLNSMQWKRLHQTQFLNFYHPFTSFCAPGNEKLKKFSLKLSRRINAIGSVYTRYLKELTECIP